MAYISHSKVINYNEKIWWVNSRKSGIYTQQMKGMLNQIEAMFSYHNKVFLLRFDLSIPEATDNSEKVSAFFIQLSNKLKAKYKLKRVGYAWTRETEKAKQQHYHAFILLDGNKVQQPNEVVEIAQYIWHLYHDGRLCWPTKRCYYQLKLSDPELLQEAVYHISYLAKVRGKGYKPAQAKNYGSSRLKKKPTKVNTYDKTHS
jgi:hypothetical protein